MPGYWMYETTGVLKPAVHRYLHRKPLEAHHIAALRAYFRQWMEGDWDWAPEIAELTIDVDTLHSREAIDDWYHRAIAAGIDPL
jgi:hypothetical protein